MPAWITRGVPTGPARGIPKENAPPEGVRRPAAGRLPEIRHRKSGTRRGLRAHSGLKSAGTGVAPAAIVVFDSPSVSFDSIVVGQSPRMRTIFDFVGLIADSESNVLIVGETGTGKETLA